MYHGPPHAPLIHVNIFPTIPGIQTLATAIARSSGKLFFISYHATEPLFLEWRLVHVSLEDSAMEQDPAHLQDGSFLVDFYIPHSSYVRYNGINQRCWLQYYSSGNLLTPTSTSLSTHLVKPSDISDACTKHHDLIASKQWVTLTHTSTYIHSPFDFASLQNQKTRDRIYADDWTVLYNHHRAMYTKSPPKLDMPTYSVHMNRSVHVSYCSTQHVAVLHASVLFNIFD